MASVPIPQRKPAIEESQGDFGSFLLDLAKGTLSRAAEIKLEEIELERLAKLREKEADADRMRDQRLTGAGLLPDRPLGFSQDQFVGLTAAGAILLLGLAALSISRR